MVAGARACSGPADLRVLLRCQSCKPFPQNQTPAVALRVRRRRSEPGRSMAASDPIHSNVQGSVKPGFESVRDLYAREIQTLAESNTQLCVYYRGERVVDLWASAADEPGFSADSLVNVFSSGKSLTAIAIASLVDKGLLDYRAKIASYWPEFASNGKADLTVADLMRHEAGMAAFDTSLEPADLLTENLAQNRVGQIIEKHPLRYPKDGRRREYHAITRGWIANELFRRVEPSGRTIGQYLREEISGPITADAAIGVTRAELDRVSKVRSLGILYQILQSLLPASLGRSVKHGFITLASTDLAADRPGARWLDDSQRAASVHPHEAIR